MKRLLPAFLLVLLSAPAAAQALASCTNSLGDVVRTEAGAYISAAIALMMMVIALAYAVGNIWANANLLVLAKDELYHLFFSIMLLFGVSGVFWLSCASFGTFMDFSLTQLGASKCYSGSEPPQAVAYCYVNRMEATARGFVTNSIKQSINNEMGSTLVVSFSNPITGGVYLPFTAYKRTFSNQFDMIANQFAMPALVSISMQKVLVGFANDVVRWLLPIAIFLRILPPMRQMGNMLVGVCIALFIVIPVFYALNGAMDEVVFKDCTQYSGLISDQVMGDCGSSTSFWLAARTIPQAFFLPNLTLAMVVTFLGGVNKALKVIG